MVRAAVVDNLPGSEDFTRGDQGRWSFLSLVGGEAVGHELDREQFIGPYRSYHNPLAVERGSCTGSEAYCGNVCGCIQTDIELQPGETRQLLVLLGVGKAEEDGVRVREEFGNVERAGEELEKLKEEWHGRLGSFVVDSPDEDFDHMVNIRGVSFSIPRAGR